MLCQSLYHSHKKSKATYSLPVNYYTRLIEMEIFKGNKNYEFQIWQNACRKCATKIKSNCANRNTAISTGENLCSIGRISKTQAQERIQDLAKSTHTESLSSHRFSNFMYTEAISLHDVNEILKTLSNNVKLLKYQIRQPVRDLCSITNGE